MKKGINKFACICGKKFVSKNALTGHQIYCRVYLGDDKYNKRIEKSRQAGKRGRQIQIENGITKKQELELWLDNKPICINPKCPRNNEPMIKKYGSGNFCSNSCAVSYSWYTNCEQRASNLSIKKGGTGTTGESKELKYKQEQKNPLRVIQCPHCDYKSITENGVKNHIRHKHLKEWEIYKENQLNQFVILSTGNRADDPHILDITNRQLNEYREKQTVCEICGIARTMISSNLCTDHCHDTMKFRGLLCFKCNTLLGQYEKHRNEIDAYLNKSYYCN